MSTNLISRVVKSLDLVSNPEFNPELIEPEPSLIERIDASMSLPDGMRKFLIEAGFLTLPAPPLSIAEAERRGYLATVETVRWGLVLTPVDGSRVISISFSSGDPETAANVVNTVAKQYIVDRLQGKLEVTRSAAEWLTERVDELGDRVQESEEAVEALKSELSVAAGQSLEITQQQLADLNKSLSDARNRTSEVKSRYMGLTDAMEAGRDLSAESALIREYRETESDLLARLNALSPRHPARAGLDAELDAVREGMRDEAGRIRSAVEVDLEAARTQERNLEKSVRELEIQGSVPVPTGNSSETAGARGRGQPPDLRQHARAAERNRGAGRPAGCGRPDPVTR